MEARLTRSLRAGSTGSTPGLGPITPFPSRSWRTGSLVLVSRSLSLTGPGDRGPAKKKTLVAAAPAAVAALCLLQAGALQLEPTWKLAADADAVIRLAMAALRLALGRGGAGVHADRERRACMVSIQ